jgi:hypothetical protein
MATIRELNQRCKDVGCSAKLWFYESYPERGRGIVQHGPNPEHIISLPLEHPDWSGAVEAWIGRIHANPLPVEFSQG